MCRSWSWGLGGGGGGQVQAVDAQYQGSVLPADMQKHAVDVQKQAPPVLFTCMSHSAL